MHDFIAAFGLLLAIEGLTFAAFPGAAKRAAEEVAGAPEGPLRIIGLLAVFAGILLLWFMRGMPT
jgi:uncharacterized protein YjeT (DUF2065 family)